MTRRCPGYLLVSDEMMAAVQASAVIGENLRQCFINGSVEQSAKKKSVPGIRGFWGSGSDKKRTEFYAWIFGAAMLGLGSLTTVSSCFVFCFCSDKVRKRREARSRRGAKDKAGEYQRVESVSSIVDHAGEHSELYDDQMDSVTII
ncbi:hypothetical protein LSH36_7g06013 [Paralvinella palmiformis]|uniref:Uncharacterized protein n=1 Tax=Paralvinella palmiformis TaxID=53620 RepID=A0AAD9KEE0_9ANNE|nr:hypothetical protein LSH36_7g06013 [Paralvinella palmiformis]